LRICDTGKGKVYEFLLRTLCLGARGLGFRPNLKVNATAEISLLDYATGLRLIIPKSENLTTSKDALLRHSHFHHFSSFCGVWNAGTSDVFDVMLLPLEL
jgi:hypothetical protein